MLAIFSWCDGWRLPLTAEIWGWTGWKENCINMCPCCCNAVCYRPVEGHTGVRRRMREVVVNVQWADQRLQQNSTLRTYTFLQILLGERIEGAFKSWGLLQGSSLYCLLAIDLTTDHNNVPFFPHLHHWLVICSNIKRNERRKKVHHFFSILSYFLVEQKRNSVSKQKKERLS